MGLLFKKKKRRRSSGRRKAKKRMVYLMERVTGREADTVARGLREIKIGVANVTDERNKQVDRGIPGDVKILAEFLFDDATRIESALHRLFLDWKFVPKGAKKGAGGQEFHKLTDEQVDVILRLLRVNGKRRRIYPSLPKINPFILIVVFAVAGAYLLQLLKPFLQ